MNSDPYGNWEYPQDWPKDGEGNPISDDQAFNAIITLRRENYSSKGEPGIVTYTEAKAYVPPPPAALVVPEEVTKLQLRNAAAQLGVWSTIRDAINSNPDAKELWELAVAVNRNDLALNSLALAYGWSSEQLDDLFRLAGTK